jgi:hypothetical protein
MGLSGVRQRDLWANPVFLADAPNATRHRGGERRSQRNLAVR